MINTDYRCMIMEWGYKLVEFKEEDVYSGEIYSLLYNPDKKQYGLYQISFGSCVVCDALESAIYDNKYQNFSNTEKLRVKWFETVAELVKYLTDGKDWHLESEYEFNLKMRLDILKYFKKEMLEHQLRTIDVTIATQGQKKYNIKRLLNSIKEVPLKEYDFTAIQVNINALIETFEFLWGCDIKIILPEFEITTFFGRVIIRSFDELKGFHRKCPKEETVYFYNSQDGEKLIRDLERIMK